MTSCHRSGSLVKLVNVDEDFVKKKKKKKKWFCTSKVGSKHQLSRIMCNSSFRFISHPRKTKENRLNRGFHSKESHHGNTGCGLEKSL